MVRIFVEFWHIERDEGIRRDTTTAATLNTLVTFDCTNGAQPETKLLIDSAGNLYGETDLGGTSNLGTLFELTKTGGLYASTPDASARVRRAIS